MMMRLKETDEIFSRREMWDASLRQPSSVAVSLSGQLDLRTGSSNSVSKLAVSQEEAKTHKDAAFHRNYRMINDLFIPFLILPINVFIV